MLLGEMAETVRTPEETLDGLPDFPFAPHYRTVDGLRLAHIDEGEGAPVVFFHGEPTWSFLWRHVIPPVRDAGFRCVAPDLAGFGRSDKPVDVGWYSYDRHVETTATLLEELDLRDATVVVHDWGGAIGLRLAVEHPERISRLVMMDTGLFTGHQRMSDAWLAFRDFVERTEDIPVGMLVRRACFTDPGDEVTAAYDAPYPDAGFEGRRARLPADHPPGPRRAGRRGGPARARCAGRGPPPRADAVGGLRSHPAAVGGRGVRQADQPARPPHDREREPLPAGGSGTADRPAHRRVAYRVISPRRRA